MPVNYTVCLNDGEPIELEIEDKYHPDKPVFMAIKLTARREDDETLYHGIPLFEETQSEGEAVRCTRLSLSFTTASERGRHGAKPLSAIFILTGEQRVSKDT